MVCVSDCSFSNLVVDGGDAGVANAGRRSSLPRC